MQRKLMTLTWPTNAAQAYMEVSQEDMGLAALPAAPASLGMSSGLITWKSDQ